VDFFKVVESRRSIRRFKNQEVPNKLMEKVLNSGKMAPSGGNMQPWEFIIVKEKYIISKIIESTFVGFQKKCRSKQDWIGTASLLIIVCADLKRTVSRYSEMGKEIALLDTAASIENILLASTALGLGCCWVSGFDKQKLSVILKLPRLIVPIAILPLGYPEDIPASPHKFSLKEIIHFERFGNQDP